MAAIARLGDMSSHGGTIISASQDVTADGIGIAREGDSHSCPISGHGITALSPITTKTYANGRLMITVGASAGCGAIITEGSPTKGAE